MFKKKSQTKSLKPPFHKTNPNTNRELELVIVEVRMQLNNNLNLYLSYCAEKKNTY